MHNSIKGTQLIILSVLLGIAPPLLACPDMQGSYGTENGGIHFYLQTNRIKEFKAVIDIADYPLTIRSAVFFSEEDRHAQPYQALPDCTLSIDGFGYLLPHNKGQILRLHFDSQDFEKIFNTSYILKLSDAPSENLGVNKTSLIIPDKILTTLNNH